MHSIPFGFGGLSMPNIQQYKSLFVTRDQYKSITIAMLHKIYKSREFSKPQNNPQATLLSIAASESTTKNHHQHHHHHQFSSV